MDKYSEEFAEPSGNPISTELNNCQTNEQTEKRGQMAQLTFPMKRSEFRKSPRDLKLVIIRIHYDKI